MDRAADWASLLYWIGVAVIGLAIILAWESYSRARFHDPELSEVRRRREEARNRERDFLTRRPDE